MSMLIDRPPPIFDARDIRRSSLRGSYPPICLDDQHFLISATDFDALPEYSGSRPTGVYDGKCWKIRRRDGWYIGCYIGCYIEEDPPHPDGMLTPIRRALIVR